MKRWAFAILLIVDMSFSSADLASAADGVAQLKDRFYDDYVLEMTDNGHVVWKARDVSDAEIFPDNGKATKQHIDYSVDDDVLQMTDNGHVVWKRRGHDDSDREIFPATPSQTGWGASSTVGVEYQSASDSLNCLFFLMVPIGVLLLWKELRKGR